MGMSLRGGDTGGPEGVGEKSESGGERRKWKWPVGLVQKGPVCTYVVPVE